jgi:DNA-binding response OmpR family regulator
VDSGVDALSNYSDADAVLLDVGLPDLDGFEICRRIRAKSDVPILMLSGRGDEFDRVLALKLGADDYVVKPCGIRELAARIEAVARRARDSAEVTGVARIVRTGSTVRQLRQMRIDIDRRMVTVGEAEVQLTRKEFDLLELLAREPGKVITRETIMAEVWGYSDAGDTRTLGVHMTSLRRKLGVPIIETVRGIGFRLAS